MSAKSRTSRFHTPGKVRWRRFAIVAVPAVAVAGVLVGLTAEGAIASSISVSGEEYTVTASQRSGTGFEQFGGEVSNAKGPQPVIVSAINSAKLTDLCQSVTIGPVTLRLTAGTGGTPASASNMIVDASGQTDQDARDRDGRHGDDGEPPPPGLPWHVKSARTALGRHWPTFQAPLTEFVPV